MTQTDLEFDRVASTIGGTILDFCRTRLASGITDFHADDLRRWVAQRHPTAPASADRILRALKRSGAVNYVVVSRRASLYHLEGVKRAA